MAKRRDHPYVWATWLAKLMAGDAACPWQYWFRANYKLTQTQPEDFDLIGWKIDHARMVDLLRRDLIAKGGKPIASHRFHVATPHGDGVIAGELDLLQVGQDEFHVYDCKTGKSRSTDSVQVMIYMHFLLQEPRLAGKSSRGVVVYLDRRVELPYLPLTFAPNLEYFADLLVDETPPTKYPGEACKICVVTNSDCAERSSESS